MKERKHLRRLPEIFSKTASPIYFITICSLNRKPILTDKEIAQAIIETMEKSKEYYNWAIGRYVIMPDHIHFFCIPLANEGVNTLSEFIQRFKRWTNRKTHRKLWQREFFDHLLRSDESYESKWQYVRNNPVRAGLCEKPEDWRWQGEIDFLYFD